MVEGVYRVDIYLESICPFLSFLCISTLFMVEGVSSRYIYLERICPLFKSLLYISEKRNSIHVWMGGNELLWN